MKMNDAGQMVQTVWDEMPNRFDGMELDRFVVMPNHIHGIIVLPRRGESCIRPCTTPDFRPFIRPFISPGIHSRIHSDLPNGRSTDHGGDHGGDDRKGDHGGDDRKGDHKDRPYGTLPGTVGRIIQAFKSITTHEYTNGVKQHGWLPFPGKLWQRNYWENIIRNESELNRIRDYVKNNPAQWESDRLYGRPTGRISEIRETATEYGLEDWMV
jgi:putative transposase